MDFRYDYTRTMMMKLFLARPNRKGGSEVLCNFEEALSIIRAIDAITCGAPKIIYLVGWQYNGHDDKYPAFFEVNPFLKRPQDKTARDSLLWLIEEAKKYHTVVSVHINLADAYENSPIFPDYVVNKALITTRSGRPAGIEEYNGLTCYKINYKAEWNSGLFHSRLKKLLALLPLEELGTVHVDNFQCYVNGFPRVSAYEMQYYRKKMIQAFAEKGIDITTEFTYREGTLTRLAYGTVVRELLPTRYPIDLLDVVPAVWWADKMTGEEIMRHYPRAYGGGLLKNEKYAAALYGNIHGEELWLGGASPDKWLAEFTRQFALINLPYFYLSAKLKRNYKEDKCGVTVEFSDGTVSDGKTGEIRIGHKILKDKAFVCLPVFWQKNGYLAYDENGGKRTLYLDGKNAAISEISLQGLTPVANEAIFDGKIEFSLQPGTLYAIKT